MATRRKARALAPVIPLFPPKPPTVSPARVEAIRRFFIEAAVQPELPIGAINIVLCADGTTDTTGIGLDTALADLFLGALANAMECIKDQVREEAALPCSVATFKRRGASHVQ